MIKAINKFMDKAPLWQVYIVGAVLTFILILGMFKAFLIEGSMTDAVVFKITLAFGLFWGGFICLVTSSCRHSQRFWDEAKAFETKLDEITSKKDLQELIETDFKRLEKMGSGSPHWAELNRLKAIIITMNKLLK